MIPLNCLTEQLIKRIAWQNSFLSGLSVASVIGLVVVLTILLTIFGFPRFILRDRALVEIMHNNSKTDWRVSAKQTD
jgi:hypothetical protein